MPRRPSVIPITKLEVSLPLDVRTQLELHLFSELEEKVPRGRYSSFVAERIREFFDNQRIDLAPYLVGAAPGTAIISGPPGVIEALKRILES